MSDHSSNASSSGSHSAPGGVDAVGDAALQAMHERLRHQKDEPREGFSILPIIMMFGGAGLTYLNGIDLAQHAGAFRANVFDFNWKPGSEVIAPPDPMKIGARVFKEAQCANCHGPEGAGQPQTYPPLAKSPWLVGDPTRAIKVVLEGMSGVVTVNGNTVNNSMPQVGQTMSPQNITYVLTYVRASFGNDIDPVENAVDPALVAKIKNDLGKRSPWSPDEILKENPLGAPAAPAAASGTAPAAASGTAPAAASGK